MSTFLKSLKAALLLVAYFHDGAVVSQKASWQERKNNDCLRHGLDQIIEKVEIWGTAKEIFDVKGALIELPSSPNCLFDHFNGTCPKNKNSSMCYCEKAESNKIVLVVNTTADEKYSDQNITVEVPCNKNETSLTETHTLQTIIEYSPVFKLNGQEVKDFSSVLYYHVPFHIELCCRQVRETPRFPCSSEIIINGNSTPGMPCVSLMQNVSLNTNYTLSFKACNKTQVIAIVAIHPLLDVNNKMLIDAIDKLKDKLEETTTFALVAFIWSVLQIAAIFIITILLLLRKRLETWREKRKSNTGKLSNVNNEDRGVNGNDDNATDDSRSNDVDKKSYAALDATEKDKLNAESSL